MHMYCIYTTTCNVCTDMQEVEREYKQRVSEGGASAELKFSYSWHLIKSSYKNDIRKGIRLMESKASPCG